MKALVRRNVDPVAWLDITDELYVFLDGFTERQQLTLNDGECNRDCVFVDVDVCIVVLETWKPLTNEAEGWAAFKELCDDILGWGYHYALLRAPVEEPEKQ